MPLNRNSPNSHDLIFFVNFPKISFDINQAADKLQDIKEFEYRLELLLIEIMNTDCTGAVTQKTLSICLIVYFTGVNLFRRSNKRNTVNTQTHSYVQI